MAGLLTSRYILTNLGVSDFGLYNVVGGIVIILNVINTAMMSTSFRFIAVEMGRDDLSGVNEIFNIAMVVHFSLALLIILLAETFGIFYIHHYLNVEAGRLDDAVFVFRFSVLATVFSILSIPFQSLITAYEKFSVSSSIEIIFSILKLGAAIFLVYYVHNRLRLFAMLISVAGLISALLYFLYSRKVYSSVTAWNFQRNRKRYREMMGFTGWTMLGAGAAVGKIQGAALIINSFFGTILNASFGIASQLNNVLLTFSRNLGQAAVPQIVKSYGSGNSNRTFVLVSYISKYSFFLLLLPAVPILLETDFVLKIWLGEVPSLTKIFCQLMIINGLVDVIGSGIPTAIQATGKIKYFQIILGSLSLLSLPVAYFVFTMKYPPYSILITYIATSLLGVLVMLILLRKLINFDIKNLIRISYLRVFYVSVGVSPLFIIINQFNESAARFILSTTTSVLWLLVVIYFAGLENRERMLIRSAVKKYLVFSR